MTRLRTAACVVAAVVAAPLLLAGGLALMNSSHVSPLKPAATAPPGGHPAPAVAPPRLVLGVYERGTPRSWRPIQQFSRATGHSPNLVLLYTGVGSRFPAAFAAAARAHHATLLIQINPGTLRLADFARGVYDRWLGGYAHQVAASRLAVIIGFAHEMNGLWYPWGRQPPASFVAAWRHIVSLFRTEGAGNVTWLWTVSHDTRNTKPIRDYWPGDRYVGWVGVDGYYFRRADTFRSVFGRKLRQVRRLTRKPVLLSEAGIGQVAGQARDLPRLFAGVAREHLLGMVWYDVAQHDGLYHQDWRLEGHPAALAAYHRGMRRLIAAQP